MTHSQTSRLFASGTANTLYATIPAQIVTDSQFPFNPDDAITVTLDGNRLIITADTDTDTEASR